MKTQIPIIAAALLVTVDFTLTNRWQILPHRDGVVRLGNGTGSVLGGVPNLATGITPCPVSFSCLFL
jgi:hypothetical protein